MSEHPPIILNSDNSKHMSAPLGHWQTRN